MTTEQENPESRDVLNTLAGIAPESALNELRQKRANLAQFTQDSYEALLEPNDFAGVSGIERDLVALRSALLAPSGMLAEHYRTRLQKQGVSNDLISAVEQFPNGGALSKRETLLLQFTDLLSLQPRDATPDNLAPLTEGGFSTRDIVTVAQLIAFVSYQARVLAGLRALKEVV